jgi:hypothetical protein
VLAPGDGEAEPGGNDHQSRQSLRSWRQMVVAILGMKEPSVLDVFHVSSVAHFRGL